jgi:hypothetical protein
MVSQHWAATVSGLAKDGTLLTLPGPPYAATYTAPATLLGAVEPLLELNGLKNPSR